MQSNFPSPVFFLMCLTLALFFFMWAPAGVKLTLRINCNRTETRLRARFSFVLILVLHVDIFLFQCGPCRVAISLDADCFNKVFFLCCCSQAKSLELFV